MIRAPLQEVTVANRPGDTLGVIHQSINSHMQAMWVIVEDEPDVLVYSKFFSTDRLNVRSSSINKRKSCKNVEKIVDTILNDSYEKIIGIRDRDSIDFLPAYMLKRNVFLTDQRDIEMQMLKSDKVVFSLKQKDSNIEPKIEYVKPIARAIGCYRIFNDIKEFGFSFKKKLKISHFRDDDAHALKQTALTELDASFFDGKTEGDRGEFERLKSSCAERDFALVCNGHDFLALLDCLAKIPRLKDFLPQCYDMEAFKQSALYSELKDWAVQHEVELFA